MATREEMFAALRAADAAGATEDAQRIAQMIAGTPKATPEPTRYEAMSTGERLLEGAKGALRRVARPMVPTADGGELGGVSPAGMDAEGAYYRQHKGELGTAGVVGDIGADIAASVAPVGAANRAAGVLTKTMQGLRGQSARVAADVGANAGYAAATAEPGERGSAALAGGAGAAGGRVLTRTLGGLARPFISKDAQTLIDAGVRPTPGQMFGDGPIGSAVRRLEDSATSIPLVGDVIKYARGRSIGEYGNAEINAALKPLGVTVKGSGREAVEQADKLVSDAYERILPQTFLTPFKAEAAVKQAMTAVKNIPLLSVEQEGKVIQYVAQKVQPAIADAMSNAKTIDGQIAKQIDAEIGFLARKNVASPNPGDHPLGEALYELQAALRGSLQSVVPGATKQLSATNNAYRQMLPVLKAADRTQTGQFTPRQLDRASGQYSQKPSDLNRAGQNVLPSTVPDSGTAGRALLGAAAVGGASLGGPAAGAALAAAVYSGPGMTFLVNGLRGVVPDKVLRGIASLPQSKQRGVLQHLAATVPAVGQRITELAPQIGRAMGTQQESGDAEQ
ncbi:hypothetical protein [Variovorax fucosicus]|uniref:hypothetical protein n=1 Tax=Variovorax fucosicus TaxID=3053517 RepID=UPI00257706DD|nr:hypothetical protein [Variovorax sp. J22G47]MDM0057351.1 hypothetical protein [Variovorax sp. J22G47]